LIVRESVLTREILVSPFPRSISAPPNSAIWRSESASMVLAPETKTPGSAGCRPAPFGSPPNGNEARPHVSASNVCGNLPQTAGWQPALPGI